MKCIIIIPCKAAMREEGSMWLVSQFMCIQMLPSLPLPLSHSLFLSLTDKPNLYSFVSILSAPSPPACLIDQLLLACGRRSDQHLVYVQSGCLWQAYSEWVRSMWTPSKSLGLGECFTDWATAYVRLVRLLHLPAMPGSSPRSSPPKGSNNIC